MTNAPCSKIKEGKKVRRKQGNGRKNPKRNTKNNPKTKPIKLNPGVFSENI